MQRASLLARRPLSCFTTSTSFQARRWLSACRVFADGSIRVEEDDDKPGTTATPPPGPGQVAVKLRSAPCTPADLRTLGGPVDASAPSEPSPVPDSTAPTPKPPSPTAPSPPHLSTIRYPFVGGSEGLWEVTASGEGVSELRPGDLAVPAAPANIFAPDEETGTWRTAATLAEAALVRVPMGAVAGGRDGSESAPAGGGAGGVELAVAAHCSSSVATAIRVLEDYTEKELAPGDRVVFTGASSAVAQILIQLAASRGLESVCLVNNDEEAALALRLGAWKATQLKEFKAMRMDSAYLVADGDGGVLGFTAARALRFRGCYVSYADVSGGGVSLPVAGQIFSDTRCRGFSLPRWASSRPAMEIRELVKRSLETAAEAGLRLEDVREFNLHTAVAAVGAARAPGGPVLLRG